MAEEAVAKPLYNTDEPLCAVGETACGDGMFLFYDFLAWAFSKSFEPLFHSGMCLPTELFCDGHPDCNDRSDEGWSVAPIMDGDPFVIMFCCVGFTKVGHPNY